MIVCLLLSPMVDVKGKKSAASRLPSKPTTKLVRAEAAGDRQLVWLPAVVSPAKPLCPMPGLEFGSDIGAVTVAAAAVATACHQSWGAPAQEYTNNSFIILVQMETSRHTLDRCEVWQKKMGHNNNSFSTSHEIIYKNNEYSSVNTNKEILINLLFINTHPMPITRKVPEALTQKHSFISTLCYSC